MGGSEGTSSYHSHVGIGLPSVLQSRLRYVRAHSQGESEFSRIVSIFVLCTCCRTVVITTCPVELLRLEGFVQYVTCKYTVAKTKAKLIIIDLTVRDVIRRGQLAEIRLGF